MHPVTGRMALITQAHVTMQGSTVLFYWRMDKFTGLHGWQSLRIIRWHSATKDPKAPEAQDGSLMQNYV